MSSYRYGAILTSELSLKIGTWHFKQTRLVLVSSIDKYAKEIELSPSENLIKKYSEFEKMEKRPHEKIIKKEYIKLKESVKKSAQSEQDLFNNIEYLNNSNIYVMSDANMDTLEFLNKIGKMGWETTGKIPTIGGIAMMRLRS